MPTTRIADTKPPCTHWDHDPVKRDLAPGIYAHECPRCELVQHFEVPWPSKTAPPAPRSRGAS